MATADSTTKLGDDLTVSAIGFGAGALTSVYGDVDDAESLATLNRCLDLDVTFIDTANVYGGGNNGCNPADPQRAARMKEGST